MAHFCKTVEFSFSIKSFYSAYSKIGYYELILKQCPEAKSFDRISTLPKAYTLPVLVSVSVAQSKGNPWLLKNLFSSAGLDMD